MIKDLLELLVEVFVLPRYRRKARERWQRLSQLERSLEILVGILLVMGLLIAAGWVFHHSLL